MTGGPAARRSADAGIDLSINWAIDRGIDKRAGPRYRSGDARDRGADA